MTSPQVLSDTADAPVPLGAGRWNSFGSADTVDARTFIDRAVLLLQGVLAATHDPDPDLLVTQLSATLTRGTRESSYPLPATSDATGAAAELSAQADRIGPVLVGWADESLRAVVHHPRLLPAGPLVVRSHCDGHLLTGEAAQMLLGPQGGPVAMQLYNEFLHQIVLLRDAMLPFTNWADVPFPVDSRGLRRIEPARAAFLSEALYRQVRHTSLVEFARQVVTSSSGAAGYAFTCPDGSAVPAAVDMPLADCPTHLLRWSTRWATPTVTTWTPALGDYDTAARPDLAALPAAGPDPDATVSATLVMRPTTQATSTVSIVLRQADRTAAVDLGQALRGHRYAHPDAAGGVRPWGADAAASQPRAVPLWPVLEADGLAQATDGRFVLQTAAQPHLVQLAALGRLYPQNVALSAHPQGAIASSTGRAGSAAVAVAVSP